MSAQHRYATRLRERGEESPLSTRELRDRLVRRRVSDYNDDDDDSMPRPETGKLCPEPSDVEPPKRTSSAATKQAMATSPPSKDFLMSSPAEVTLATMPSPQISRIEDRDTPTSSPRSAVKELETIRRSMTSSSPSPTLNRSNVSTRSIRVNRTSEIVDGGVQSEADQSIQTPKRLSSKPIKRTLSLDSSENLSKSSKSCFTFVIKSTIAFAILAFAFAQFWQLERRFDLNRLFVQNVNSFNATLSLETFLQDLKTFRHEKFPSQDKKTWTAIGASVKSVFRQNKTMPACLLLIGNDDSGQRAANCLAEKLAESFHKSIHPHSADYPVPLDAGSLSGLDENEAKRSLFGTLDNNLTISHSLSLLNIHKLSGNVAMTLHAFCDEGSIAAKFPLSTLFMTIENTRADIVSTSTESLADALLNTAWSSDIGIDKVSSLISRVAVSVAQVASEPGMTEECF